MALNSAGGHNRVPVVSGLCLAPVKGEKLHMQAFIVNQRSVEGKK